MESQTKTIYIFDDNIRVYPKDANGKRYGSPIFREKFVPYEVLEETKTSYITSKGNVSKSSRYVFATEQEMEDYIFICENGYNISLAVGQCRNANKLRKIQEILNCKDKKC